ncbi:glycerate kinase [Neobittarella massiliensis]|uniref:Glycerate kinase n=1 Tax=Neobittarella massiliensis (ex Bilen et al. 2018) TaxID=2041842 RepID=A0A8J6LTZ2_9FIRM|nr:glycerate kinase [Neobittarella massiliensis]
MKKILLVPDSFKGTLSAREVCAVIAERAQALLPETDICQIPVADGGEGSVDCLLQAVGGQKVTCPVAGPFFDELTAFYGVLRERPGHPRTAVIEMAACAGLPLAETRLDPEKTTTYGVGQLIAHAVVHSGCRQILLGLGGSATNDGGCGMAAALGVRFTDREGRVFVPTGGTLSNIAAVDTSGLLPQLSQVEITAICDIDNPLTGPQGAAAIFGPQKGADRQMVARLDAGLKHLAEQVLHDLGTAGETDAGAGAAGGMGFGVAALLGGRLRMGIEVVLDTVGFQQLAQDADLIITGEGRLDGQSARGKVVSGVCKRAKELGVPVVALVGALEKGYQPLYRQGLTAAFSINPRPEDFATARHKSAENLAQAAENLLRLFAAAQCAR